MATRQRRIDGLEKIKAELPALMGQKATLVLKDRSAVFGTLVAMGPEGLVLANMRRQKHKIDLSSLVEIIIDTKGE